MIKYSPQIHNRRSIRLMGCDYGEMILNDTGRMMENKWLKNPKHFTNSCLYEYVVIPNRTRTILEIMVGATLVVAQIMVAQLFSPPIVGQPQGFAPTGEPPPTCILVNHPQTGNISTKKSKIVDDMVGAF